MLWVYATFIEAASAVSKVTNESCFGCSFARLCRPVDDDGLRAAATTASPRCSSCSRQGARLSQNYRPW